MTDNERAPHSELRLEFEKRLDKHGKTYLICLPDLPVQVDLGSCTLFWWPDDR